MSSPVQEWLVEQQSHHASSRGAVTTLDPPQGATETRRSRRAQRDAASRSAPPVVDGVRRDIQGLRAVAVLIVLVFHFWPDRLTGGYVGVDVFFVISGFLISSHLLRSPPVTPRLLARFWARRVRRLLPAASLVLLATLIASLVWLPTTQIPSVAREVVASAVSLENWALAASSTDYLAAENAPSPVQHYWSLSVEEQFYLMWPVLIAVLFFLGRGRRPLAWCAAGLVAVTSASLVSSVTLTASDPASAYFVTQTRVWELGLGSMLALGVHRGWRVRHRVAQAVLGWLGLSLIAWAAFTYDSATPFPGSAALVPTIGAALVIAAATDAVPGSPRALLGWRGTQHLGDVSYSVYLWHWPVVVIAPAALGAPLDLPQKLLAVALVVLVAGLTKTFVEDPVRRATPLTSSLRRSFGLALASVLVLGTAGFVVIHRSETAQAAEAQALTRKVEASDCVGAEAMRSASCTSITGGELLSSPAVARDDKSVLYADGCWSNRPYTAHNVCHYGDPSGVVKVALLGNSHAGHWQPTLDAIADERGWALDTYLVSQCYTVDVPLEFGSADLTRNCTAWNEWAVAAITERKYDVVVMSDRTFQQVVGVSPSEKFGVTQRAYARTLSALTKDGAAVLVLRDIPGSRGSVPDCVAAHLDDPEACNGPVARTLEGDPLYAAAKADGSGRVEALDLTDRFCRDGTCHVVIGGLVAYFDHGHMTATFARTLVPDVAPALDRALARATGGR